MGLLGRGFDMIAGFPVARGVAGNPLRSPGEGDEGHASVAKLAECWRVLLEAASNPEGQF